MRWSAGRRSTNIEDRRGFGAPTMYKGGGCMILVVIVVSLLFGQNPLKVLQLLFQQAPANEQTQAPSSGANPTGQYDQQKDFVSAILASTEDTWGQVFSSMGRTYEPPKLVLFSQGVQSACGLNSAAVGPFYCPYDAKVYLDLSFFQELDQRFGAPGDFAQAYVVAHEVGHHVQNLMGISDKVQSLRERAGETESNALSVRQELQADCFAGVWGFHANQRQNMLEPGDVEEGLKAASAIGDDVLQRQSGGYVQPESWTHGSAEMRVTWLRRGLQSGQVDSCDTFK
jgi:predicted metalloprotease